MKAVRTDMASELHDRFEGDLEGVEYSNETVNGLTLISVNIYNDRGEALLGKPRGQYYTLQLPRLFDRGSEIFQDAVQTLAMLIERCIPEKPENVLVAALGNPDITPDALGSLSAGNILVTRHLKKQNEEAFQQFCSLSLCRPGVLGTSGIESAEQVRLFCENVRPDLVIVIDALAGAEAENLCRNVQVSDAGISPGSGVGNDRKELSKKTLGVPVISIGIPTVIDAGIFGDDKMKGMFVTPKDIDSMVRAGGRLIGYAVNVAMHHGISIADIEGLLG